MPGRELAVSCLLEWRNQEWLSWHHQSYESPNSNMEKQEVPVWSISIRFVLSGCLQGDFNTHSLLSGFQKKWSFASRVQGRTWKEIRPLLNPLLLNGTLYYFPNICYTNLLSWPSTALTVLFVWNKNNSGSEEGYFLQWILPQKPAFLGLYHTIRHQAVQPCPPLICFSHMLSEEGYLEAKVKQNSSCEPLAQLQEP